MFERKGEPYLSMCRVYTPSPRMRGVYAMSKYVYTVQDISGVGRNESTRPCLRRTGRAGRGRWRSCLPRNRSGLCR